MRDLTPEEIMMVVGGDGEGGGGGPPITVTGIRPPPFFPGPPGNPSYPTPPGGGSPTPSPANTPVAKLLQGYTKVTIGHHNVYLPADLDSATDAEKQAVKSFEDAIRNVDSKINAINNDARLTVTETWKDASGVDHTLTVNETGLDLKNKWNSESFAVVKDAAYNSNPLTNGTDSNQTGRGSASIGQDPNMSGNNVSAFALDQTVVGYNNSNGVSGEQYLVLHEVAHLSAAGVSMNSATGTKDYNDFSSNSSNHANENLANTIALALEQKVGLSLGNYTSSDSVSGGWQTGDTWFTPPQI